MDEQPAWIMARLPTAAKAFDAAQAAMQERERAAQQAAQKSGG